MKYIFYFFALFLMSGCCCCKKNCPPDQIWDDNSCECYYNPTAGYGNMNITVNEGSGNVQKTSNDATMTASNDSTEVDASFDNGRWLWFRLNGQSTGIYQLNDNDNISIYNTVTNQEYVAASGEVNVTDYIEADKRIKGNLNNLKLVGPMGDTIYVQGTFDINR